MIERTNEVLSLLGNDVSVRWMITLLHFLWQGAVIGVVVAVVARMLRSWSASIMSGLTPEEFAAIISHEFAHIRRFDLWVNLLQRVIESLLFFHPVVWLVSRRLSTEREICCDDLVVRSGCAPMNYAGALLRMAELCATSRQPNVVTLAASGDEPSLLEHRIERLMNASKPRRLQLTRAGVLALMLTLALLLAIPSTVRNWAQADEPKTPDAAKVDETEPVDSPIDEAENEVDGEATISGRMVMEDGSPATTKGWMQYISQNKSGTSIGGAGQHTDSFSFKCQNGTVWLIHFPDDYAPTWAGPFELKPGAALADVVLVLKPGTSKLVRITNEDGEPIVGATLVVHPVTDGSPNGPNSERTTNEKGEFLLEHLAETKYTLRCSAPGYQTLRSEPLRIDGDEVLQQTLKRSEITTGIVLNADGTPAVGARLLACAEVFESGSANSMSGSGSGFFGTELATADSEGRFRMNQLSSGSQYLFVIETVDHARAILHSIMAGQKDLKFTIPQRLELHVTVIGDTSKLPQRSGKPFVSVRQRVNLRPDQRTVYGGFIGADAFVEVNKTGGTAIFRGLAVDLHPTPEKQYVEVSLGYSNELKKTVELNLSGDTEVEFTLPGNPPNAAIDEKASVKADEVEVKYPHCIVDVEDLKTRPLADAIADFNRDAQASPIGLIQPPITEQETLDAIATSLAQPNVSASTKAVLREIAKAKQLPANVYFRRFTRFDDEQQMHEVWWVRLVVESEEPPIYSVPVRTAAMKSRPYTQMERQQNAQQGVTLINRFVSYFAEPPNILLLAAFPKTAIDRLVSSAETSIKAKDVEAFQSLFEWNGVSDSTRDFVKAEFEMLTGSTIHSIKVTPRNFRGELIHWSAYQHYEPNLEIVGYLDTEYTNNETPRKTLSLEMGKSGDALRLVNYVKVGELNLPKGPINGLSIRGHLEPLVDGTFLVTSIITNPGLLISAHVANEEIWQRDFEDTKTAKNANVRIHYDIPGAEAVAKVAVFDFSKQGYLGTEELSPGSGITVYLIRNGSALELKDTRPGEYEVSRYATAAGQGRMLDRQRFQLAVGESKSIDMTRPNGKPISGRVVNLDGLDLASTLVTVFPESTKDIKLAAWQEMLGQQFLDFHACQANGTFTTDLLVPGNYVILVEGYEPLPPDAAGLGIQRPRYLAKADITVPTSGDVPAIEITLQDMYENIDWMHSTSGKYALKFIEDLKPAWSKAQHGIELGVSFGNEQPAYRVGQRIPLLMFLRNVSDQSVRVSMAADFQSNGPKVRDAQGQVIPLELLDPNTKYSGYRETLKPGEAFGFRTYGLGLGENPLPGKQNWFNPFWKAPAVGEYTLTQNKQITIVPLNHNAAAEWTVKFTSGTINFEIVDDQANAANSSIRPNADKLADSAEVPDVKVQKLLSAADLIQHANVCRPDDMNEDVSAAFKLLLESPDSEAANLLALRLVNFTGRIKMQINNVRFAGFFLLIARDRESTLKFLTSMEDGLPEGEQKRIRQLRLSISRFVVPVNFGSGGVLGGDSSPAAARTDPAPEAQYPNRTLIASIMGKKIFDGGLDDGDIGNNTKKLPQAEFEQQLLNTRGERLLQRISAAVVADYVEREKIEISPEMAKEHWNAVIQQPLPPSPDDDWCDESRLLMGYGWSRASLKDWLICKSLHEKYGGRVGMGSLGLWIAVDGRNALMKEYLDDGRIQIYDAQLEQAFWKAANKPNFADTYPTGERLKQLMSIPPYRRQ